MTFISRSSKDPAADNSGKVDGRRLRSERTERQIVEAYIALARERQQVPTAAQIAERAGYSVRSIFERFPDLLALRLAAADHAIAERISEGALRDIEGDRPARIRAQVSLRAQGCEKWLPLWRVLNADHGGSDELKQRIYRVRLLVMARIEVVFRPELSALAAPERRKIVIAIEALVDFESWGRMRELYRLSFEEARNVWIRALDRLLPPTATTP